MLTSIPLVFSIALVFASDYNTSEPLYESHSSVVLSEIKASPQPSWGKALFNLPPAHELLHPLDQPQQQYQSKSRNYQPPVFDDSVLTTASEPDLELLLPHAQLSRNRFARTFPPPSPAEGVSLFSPISETTHLNFSEIPADTPVEVALTQPAAFSEPSVSPHTVPPPNLEYERILELYGTMSKIERIRLDHHAQIANIRLLFPLHPRIFDDGLAEMDFIFNRLLEPFQNELAKRMSARYGYDIPTPDHDEPVQSMPEHYSCDLPASRSEPIPEPQPEAQQAMDAIVLPAMVIHQQPARASRKRTKSSPKNTGLSKKPRGTY